MKKFLNISRPVLHGGLAMAVGVALMSALVFALGIYAVSAETGQDILSVQDMAQVPVSFPETTASLQTMAADMMGAQALEDIVPAAGDVAE